MQCHMRQALKTAQQQPRDLQDVRFQKATQTHARRSHTVTRGSRHTCLVTQTLNSPAREAALSDRLTGPTPVFHSVVFFLTTNDTKERKENSDHLWGGKGSIENRCTHHKSPRMLRSQSDSNQTTSKGHTDNTKPTSASHLINNTKIMR